MLVGKERDVKQLSMLVFLPCVLAAELLQAQISLKDGPAILFATADEARGILTSSDDFVQRMSPFDRAARMKTDQVVTEQTYLEFVGKNVLEWDDAGKQKVTSALQAVQRRFFREFRAFFHESCAG